MCRKRQSSSILQLPYCMKMEMDLPLYLNESQKERKYMTSTFFGSCINHDAVT